MSGTYAHHDVQHSPQDVIVLGSAQHVGRVRDNCLDHLSDHVEYVCSVSSLSAVDLFMIHSSQERVVLTIHPSLRGHCVRQYW
jgi:hypothetical protein